MRRLPAAARAKRQSVWAANASTVPRVSDVRSLSRSRRARLSPVGARRAVPLPVGARGVPALCAARARASSVAATGPCRPAAGPCGVERRDLVH